MVSNNAPERALCARLEEIAGTGVGVRVSKRGWLRVCAGLVASAIVVVTGQVLSTAELWSGATLRGKAHLVARGFNLPSSLMLLAASLVLLVVVEHPLESVLWRRVVTCGFIVGLLFFAAGVFQVADIAWEGDATTTLLVGLAFEWLAPAIIGLVIAGVYLPLIRQARKSASEPEIRDADTTALPN
jgi:hypothetical protein